MGRDIACMLCLVALMPWSTMAVAESGCGHLEGRPQFAAPRTIEATSPGRTVTVAPDAELARDVVLVTERTQVVTGAVRFAFSVAGAPAVTYIYPAGSAVGAAWADGSSRNNCLGGLPAAPVRVRTRSTQRIACLTDADGDGAYERVAFFGYDPAMHVVRFESLGDAPLAAPVRLRDDPAGAPGTGRRVLRRVLFGAIEGDSLAIHERREFEEPHRHGLSGDWAETAPAVRTLVPGQLVMPPFDGATYATAPTQTIRLSDRLVTNVGGYTARFERAGDGWRATLVAGLRDPWVRLVCDARAIDYDRE